MGILDAPALVTPHLLRRERSYMRGLAPITTRLHAAASPQATTDLSDGTQTSQMHRTIVKVTADAQDLRLVFSNYSYGTAGLNTIYVRAAIEIDQGNVGTSADNAPHPAQFGGQLELTLSPDCVATSDPIPIRVRKGDTIYIRTYVRVANAGEKWPGTTVYRLTATNDHIVAGGTDQTNAGGGLSGTLTSGQYARAYGPLAVLGVVAPGTPVFGLFGDSITVGLNADIDALSRGWAELGLNENYPYVNLSRHAEGINQLLPALYTTFTRVAYRHKWRFLDGCTHVLTAYGVNDLNGTDTAAAVMANLLSNWTELNARGLKVWQGTLTPRTTSTDSWATVGNQTRVTAASADTKLIAVNDWIRDGAPILAGAVAATGSSAGGTVRIGAATHPVRGYLELADSVESARNSGLWKAGYTGDGIHPGNTGHAAMAAVLSAALPTILAS